MTQIIIFSKNRAIMLDALLRSISTYIKRSESDYFISVIYRATNKKYIEAYKWLELQQTVHSPNKHIGHFENQEVYFLPEWDFRKNLLNMYSPYYDKVCFMVDDDIIYSEFKFPSELKPFQTHSLRLHKGIKNPIHFNYNISLDGNIFNWADIRPLLYKIEFNNPNELESRLQGGFGKLFTQTYDEGHIMGFNHTRVSEGSKCSFTSKYTDEKLNDMYLSGERIDFESMNIGPTSDVHTSMEYKFKKI